MLNQKTNVVNINDLNDLDATNFTIEKINIQFKNGETYLHHAVDAGNLKMVVFLLKNGCNPNVKGLGRTPLGLAISNLKYPNLYDKKEMSQIIQELINAL